MKMRKHWSNYGTDARKSSVSILKHPVVYLDLNSFSILRDPSVASLCQDDNLLIQSQVFIL